MFSCHLLVVEFILQAPLQDECLSVCRMTESDFKTCLYALKGHLCHCIQLFYGKVEELNGL